MRDSSKVKEAFDLAILSARDAGFNHDEALANELAGEYLIRHGRGLTARVYLTNSRDLYAQWYVTSAILCKKCIFSLQWVLTHAYSANFLFLALGVQPQKLSNLFRSARPI